MAFNTNTPRVSYIATAGQTVFPFTFKIFTNTNITVYKNQVALVLSTDYTVTINGDSGGGITLLVGASLNDEIIIIRSLPITREFDYQDNGDFFADTVDDDQDYQTYLVQDVDAKFERTFKLPDAISGTVSSDLPFPIDDAYIRWNSDGTAIVNDTTIPSAVSQAEDARDEATVQAGIATTKAGEASTSATNALASEVQAGIYAGQLDPSKIVAKDSPTGASFNPVGTTAQRPTMPTNGYIRYNTDLLAFEGYSNGAWTSLGGLGINTLAAKATPIDADEMVLADSTSSFSLKKFTWANLKATILAYMQTTTMSKIIQGTAVASTSGTSIDFTGIPSWAKKITVMFNGVSTSGTSNFLVQIGSGSVDTTGYASSCSAGATTSVTTNGFISTFSMASTYLRMGEIHLNNITSNIWQQSGILADSSNAVVGTISGGSKTLSSTLDRIRITTVNGTDTFDAGQINIIYEG